MLRHLLLACLLVAAVSAALHATILVPGDLTDLAREATLIVRGRIADVRSEFAEGRRRIVTVATVAVDETFKGQVVTRLHVQVPGGLVGRYRSVAMGAPSFRVGEQVVLFLGGSPAEFTHPLGLGQGVFRVVPDAATGRLLVTPPPLLADPARTVTVQRGDPLRRRLPVAEFSAMVRTLVAAGSTRDPRRDPPVVRKDTGRGR